MLLEVLHTGSGVCARFHTLQTYIKSPCEGSDVDGNTLRSCQAVSSRLTAAIPAMFLRHPMFCGAGERLTSRQHVPSDGVGDGGEDPVEFSERRASVV